MIKKNKIWGSLSFRLLWVVCWTFLPLNIIAVVVSGIVVWNSANRVFDSYNRELTISMNRFENHILKLEDWVDAFILEYLSPLMLENGSDNMISYEMIDRLGDIYSACDMEGLILLYDKNEKRPYVKYGSDLYTAREIEQIKKQILRSHILKRKSQHWRIISIGGRFYYARYYDYANYRLAFLMDMNLIFQYGVGEDKYRENFYFTDHARILRLEDGQIVSLTGRKWKELFMQGSLYESVLWQSESLGCSAGILFYKKDFLNTIPVIYWALMAMAVLCICLLFGMWRMLQKRVVKPLNVLQNAMEELERENLRYRIMNQDETETDNFKYIYETFNHMADEIRDSHEKDLKMYEAQLNNLRLQVNPHMLLNSFNMIYSLAQSRNYSCIQDFSLCLVEYFRYVLKENDTFVTLEKEMRFVENYIGIQKIRFPGAFTSVYDMEKGTEKALVPPLLIQNFVENSMKYALTPGKVTEVLINIRREGDRLLVSICDTGNGIKEEVLEALSKGEIYTDKIGQKHIGIWNCRRRMEVFYGGRASMNIVSSRGNGTQVWLELPYLEENPETVRDDGRLR